MIEFQINILFRRLCGLQRGLCVGVQAVFRKGETANGEYVVDGRGQHQIGIEHAGEIRRLRAGVRLDDDRMTSPADVHLVRYETFASVLLVTIHEGRNRQVRRMFETVGHTVLLLRRVKFGPLEMGELKRGEWRELTENEIEMLREL